MASTPRSGRLEAHVFDHGAPGPFWGGRSPALTDICYWSLFDVLERLDSLAPVRRLLEARPRMAEWSGHVLAYPAFREASERLAQLSPSEARADA